MSSNPNHPPSVFRHLGGFSMVEILVGLMLGLFLMAGILQLFVANKQTYRFHDALSRMQENGRFALEVLSNSIRMTGFTGCPASNSVTNVLCNNTCDNTWWRDFDTNPLLGYDGTAAFPDEKFTTAGGKRISGTDAIISLGGGGGVYSVTAVDAASTPTYFSLNTRNRPNGPALNDGDIATICNTQNTTLFQVTTVNTSPVTIEYAQGACDAGACPSGGTINNSSADLGGTAALYTANQASMVDYIPTAFYIGTSNSGTTRSLYQSQLQGAVMAGQELVEGVQDMQIFYGEDTSAPPDGIADVYLDAANVTNWANVTIVRINLLLVSLEDNIVNQPQSYEFPNDTGDSAVSGRRVTATDRRLYQTFSTTIGIRNRLP